MENRPIAPYSNPELQVPIIQGKWEFEELLKIVERQQPARSLEIGSFFGGTLWHWVNASRVAVASVDMLVPEADPRRKLQDECRAKWPSWAEKKGISLETFLGDSGSAEAVAFMEKNGPYDFVFIDGDHSYGSVKADFENALRFSSKRGIIALHDILPATWWGSIEVWRFWDELVAQGYVTQVLCSRKDQLFEFADMSTWGIGVVRLGA